MMTAEERIKLEQTIRAADIETLEADLARTLRKRAYTERAVALAEDFMAKTEAEHILVDTTHELVYRELTRRHAIAAQGLAPEAVELLAEIKAPEVADASG